MNSRSLFLLVVAAALIIAGAIYLFVDGTDGSSSGQPSPHAIDQNQ